MAHHTAPPPVQRFAVLGAVLALHLVLILLVLATKARRVPAALEPAISTVISIAADQAAPSPPPPPTLPSKIAETNRPLTEAVAEIVDPASTAASGGGCATIERVANGLLADPVALEAVLRAPPETRSIADAIVIWNAGWSEAASTIGAPLGAVRAATELSLGAMEDSCLDEPLAGPRLIPIPAGARTMFVVFGSGNWRWRDLLAEKLNPAVGDKEQDVNPLVAPSPRN